MLSSVGTLCFLLFLDKYQENFGLPNIHIDGFFLSTVQRYFNSYFFNFNTIFLSDLTILFFFYWITFNLFFSVKDKNFNFTHEDFIIYFYFFLLFWNFLFITFSTNLLNIYVGIELFSIVVYTILSSYTAGENITAMRRTELSSKYLIPSFIGSLTLLVGIAFSFMTFGTFDTTDYYSIFIGMPVGLDSFGLAPKTSILFIIMGLCIKAGLAPYHTWINGVYDCFIYKLFQFMLIFWKYFFFLIIFNLINTWFLFPLSFFGNNDMSDIKFFFYLLGFLNLLTGTCSATLQTNLKKFLMYSSVRRFNPTILIAPHSSFSLLFRLRTYPNCFQHHQRIRSSVNTRMVTGL